MNGCGRCCVDRQTAEIFAKTGGPPPIYRAVLTIQLKPGCRAVIRMRYSDPFAHAMVTRREQQAELTPAEAVDRIWKLAEEIDICMFVTWDGQYNRARPLSARVSREENAIYFLVNDHSAKNKQLSTYPKVTLAWSDSRHYKYATISGSAAVTNDRKKIADLWEKTDAAWWDNADDPEIRLITVKPDEGELWDSPGLVVATAKMMFAAVTGSKPDVGDNAKVDL